MLVVVDGGDDGCGGRMFVDEVKCDEGDERMRRKIIMEMRREGEVFLSDWMGRGRRFLLK